MINVRMRRNSGKEAPVLVISDWLKGRYRQGSSPRHRRVVCGLWTRDLDILGLAFYYYQAGCRMAIISVVHILVSLFAILSPSTLKSCNRYLSFRMEASTCTDSRPEPIDLSHLYSKVTANRTTSNVKDFYKYFGIPGIGNLAGGLPNNNYFPFDTLEAAAALPQRFTPTPNKPVDPPSDLLSKTTLSDGLSTSRVVVPKTSDNQDILRQIDLKTALQYGTAQGYPPLYSFLRQFTTENLHPNVPYAGGPEIILTCGATDGFCKAIDALSNTWNEDRDWIGYREGLLVEEFCYMNAVQTAKPRGLNIVPVAIDDEGMVAHGKGGLFDVLDNWDKSRGKRPHMIYTVT